MQGKRIIHNIQLRDLLSFGSQSPLVELQPLNVLIGPNSSGKSNFIEAIRLLSYLPENLENPLLFGGGIDEYHWKGERLVTPEIQVNIDWKPENPLTYYLRFMAEESSLYFIEEYLGASPFDSPPEPIYQLFNNGSSQLFFKEEVAEKIIEYKREDISPKKNQSILSQLKDPIRYPAFSYLQEILPKIQFYEKLDTGRFSGLRQSQKINALSSQLLEDGSNLVVSLINQPASLRQKITDKLRTVFPTVEEIRPKIEGGRARLFIREKRFATETPAERLSEGALRYLCLLTLLLDPDPPPIICIEEPETGLHPHAISQIAELLIDASQRTQLIVTTHSDALISGLSECPEAIITCERDDEGTKLRRLDPEQIKPWLDRYALGDLWRMGEIGGVR